jgi:hypothetical protein
MEATAPAARTLIPWLHGGICELGDTEDGDCGRIAVYLIEAPAVWVKPLLVCAGCAAYEHDIYGTPIFDAEPDLSSAEQARTVAYMAIIEQAMATARQPTTAVCMVTPWHHGGGCEVGAIGHECGMPAVAHDTAEDLLLCAHHLDERTTR